MTINISSDRYKRDGCIRKNEPSIVAKLVHDYTNVESQVIDIGCGCEWDLAFLADKRRICTGIYCSEIPPVPDMLSHPSVEYQQVNGASLLDTSLGWFDAIQAHLVVHSWEVPQLNEFRSVVTNHLRPGGYLIVSAKKQNRLNLEQKRQIPLSTTEEINSSASFWTESRFRQEFAPVVDILELRETEDPESTTDPVFCPQTIMIARRSIPVLSVPGLYSKPLTADDKPWLYRSLFSQPDVMKYWMAGKCLSQTEMESFINATFDLDDSGAGYRIFYSAENNARVAVTGLHARELHGNRFMEVSLLVDPAAQAGGIGSRLFLAARDWNRANRIGDGLIAFVEPRNVFSLKACKSAGFIEIDRVHLPERGTRIVLKSECW